MSHDESFELLAPLALDALDADSRADVEAHVASCPECQSELDGLREVAAALGNAVESPPEELWTKISSHLYDVPRGEGGGLPSLLSGYPVAEGQRVRRVVRRARVVVTTTLLAAAAAILVLALNLSSESTRVTNLQSALASSVVTQALAAPGHRVVTLDGSNHQALATFVVLRDGTGYLVSSKMPALPANETYQLWGIVAGKPVSIGIMGSQPRHATFTLASFPTPSTLGVTVEPASGSVTPTTPMVASGAV
jgi:anti-sigma-K factor RskA